MFGVFTNCFVKHYQIGAMSREIGFAWTRLSNPQKEIWKAVARADQTRYEEGIYQHKTKYNVCNFFTQ